ncbi:MAG TPA: flotillin family protein, partial [Firmicutes bacterium]|nr:flotillin family protein [Bacillota bacterium]
GGGTFVLPLIERAEVLPLEVFTVEVKTSEVLTSQGIPIAIEGTSQVRVKTDDHSIRLAAELFLGKGIDGMREIAHQIIEGHVRAAIGMMTVEQIYRNRKEFGDVVEKAVQQDFDRLGLSIISFSITDISDSQGYLEALGRPQIAKARHDAEVAEAESAKEAAIKAAIARKEGDIAKLQAETEVAEATRDYEAKRAQYQAAVNQERARADAAYELERQRLSQEIKKEEAEAILIAKKKAIEIEEMEIKRREKELDATVRKPAEAESFRHEMQAKARAVARKLEGSAEVEILKARGVAEAEAMKKKAESWREYNQAAVYQMFIDVLPSIAKAIAEPLSKVEKIIIVGGAGDSPLGASKITGEVARMMAQLPTIVESLGGKELKNLLTSLGRSEQEPKRDEEDKSEE